MQMRREALHKTIYALTDVVAWVRAPQRPTTPSQKTGNAREAR